MTGFLLVVGYFAVAGLAAVIALQPSHFTVTRSAVIDAPPNVVFRHINELRNWEAWSPWAKLDPAAQNAYEGPASGPGAAFAWTSANSDVGAGRMTIVDSRPNQAVTFKLEMKKPFAATNDVSFSLAPEPGEAPSRGGWWFSRLLGFGPDAKDTTRTLVTWTMSGKNTIISKVMNVVMNMDKIVGGQFENGLANLNSMFAR
jgi:hypothetical protein